MTKAVSSPRPVAAVPPGDTDEPLVPNGWTEIEGLVCGFGSRRAEPPAGTILLRRQVHGREIVPASAFALESGEADGLPRLAAEADALVVAGPGVVAGVRTADCVPLLLVAPREGWAAAVHAGWRGTLAGIATAAVDAARRDGIDARHLLAALGPSIGPCCYEVSEELGRDFESAGLPVGVGAASSRPHLDLRAANRLLLESCGLARAAIQTVGPCTRCAKDLYHSYRAEPGSEGRQVSWIGWAGR